MRWSLLLIVVGALLIAAGFAPIIFAGLTIGALESAVSLAATGLLFLLIGIMLRKLHRSMQ